MNLQTSVQRRLSVWGALVRSPLIRVFLAAAFVAFPLHAAQAAPSGALTLSITVPVVATGRVDWLDHGARRISVENESYDLARDYVVMQGGERLEPRDVRSGVRVSLEESGGSISVVRILADRG